MLSFDSGYVLSALDVLVGVLTFCGQDFRRFGGEVCQPSFNCFYIKRGRSYILKTRFGGYTMPIFYGVEF